MNKRVYRSKNLYDIKSPNPNREINYIDTKGSELTYDTYDEFNQNNPKTGYLKMQVYTAQQAVPLENANITVTKVIGKEKHIFANEKTGRDGTTRAIPLPTPDKSLSTHPQNIAPPYSTYDVLVEYPRFRSVELLSVPIFEDIVSIQPVNMLYSGSAQPPQQVRESEPEDL